MTTRILIAAVLALAALLGLQTLRLADERAAHAETRAEHAAAMHAMAEAARQAEGEQRAEEQRRIAAMKEIADEAHAQRDRALADAAAARSAGERLRAQLAAFTAGHRQASGDPDAATDSPPASTALDLLADLLARHSAELVEVGAFADRAHAAGLACERSFDALTH